MHSSQFGITFTDSRGPVNSDGPIHCIRSLNRMVRYSVMPLPERASGILCAWLNVTSIYPRINPAYVELACEPAPAKPCRLAQFSGAPRGTGGISGNCRSPPVGFILGAGTIDTRHFSEHQ